MRDLQFDIGWPRLTTRSGVALLILVAVPFLSRAASVYSVQSLGPLGSGVAQPSAINDSGLAVGYITNSQGNQAAISFANGQSTTLGVNALAQGVNNSGIVVGVTYKGLDPSVAEWSHGQLTTLPISGYATSINNLGQVAGGYITSNNELHAYVSTGGTLTDLGTLGGTWSSAYGINSIGQVTGTSLTSSSVFRAFFTNSSGMNDIGTLGGSNSYGMAINDSGHIVGNSQTLTGFSHAFVWTGQRMIDLGTLGGSQSYAYGINNSDLVVGASFVTGNEEEHGFVYSNGVLADLNDLLPLGSGWTIDNAYAVNNTGDILATGTLNGQSFAVELTPSTVTPEPSGFLFAAAGLIGIGIARSRRLHR